MTHHPSLNRKRRSGGLRAATSLALQLCIGALSVLALGCTRAPGPPRYDVSGAVTWNGSPVQSGRIVFEPDPARGNSGPQGFALIDNGRYDTSATGQGSVGGPQIVIIHGYDGRAASDDAPFGIPIFPEQREQRDLPLESTRVDFSLASPSPAH